MEESFLNEAQDGRQIEMSLVVGRSSIVVHFERPYSLFTRRGWENIKRQEVRFPVVMRKRTHPIPMGNRGTKNVVLSSLKIS